MQDNKLLMTEGSICKKIIMFAFPIFLGNLFQQLYNVVDALIVGNYVGKEALAAISSTGSLIFLIVGLFGGIFSGAGVVIGRYVGARTVALFYFLLAFSHCMAGILRGAGKSIIPMLVMLIFWCFIRVTYITVGTYLVEDVRVVFSAYPLTWSLSSIVFMIYYLKSKWLYAFKEKQTKAMA